MIKAAVLTSPRAVRVDDVEVGALGPNDVRVRLDGCGLCGSDLALWQGRPWFEYPQPAGAPGHEAWGVVEEVGEAVHTVAPGLRVAGLFHQAFAESAVTDQGHVVVVPPNGGSTPFAGEPLACAANAVRRANVQEGDQVVVVGVGFIGAAITGFAKAAGADVVAVSRRAYACAVARSMGADDALRLDEDVEAYVHDHTRGRLADIVFEATGRQAPLDLAARLVRVRGRLVVAGYHQDAARTVDMQLWNWRGMDVINAHEREPEAYMEGMRRAASLVAAGRVDFAPLYTHAYPLGRLGDAFSAMEERPEGFLKAVVRP